MLDLFNENGHDSNLPPIGLDELSDGEVIDEIWKLKSELTDEVVILGHHYQQDDIIQFADFRGDSLALAKSAVGISKPYIVFCGVHFMAETADIITSPKQQVILPDLSAGCSMADMACRLDIDKAWGYLKQSTDQNIIPITYINCSADLKSFVGENSGSICTSSNARKIIEWAFSKGEKLLFFPDQHLGRNTCFEMGISLEEMVIYDPHKVNGGLTKKQIQDAKVILWYGYCSVHQGFTVEQVHEIKKSSPDTTVIVHPECTFDVVQAADLNGSTAYILDVITNAPAKSKFAVGTEINLVNRLAHEFPDKEIISLSPYQCLCTTMYRVRPRWLLATLRSIKKNEPINVIKVDPKVKEHSLVALDSMLSIC
ncbi:MAG: quinolinate synthase NadA [Bacteriovoracaceae bacterium]|nr:quinolinate synthase NadA [Bacteriovoracaceae bacterium]